MTVVASFSVEGYPVMFGDLLLSGDEGDEKRQANLPTIIDMEEIFPKGSGFVPIGLSQKIHIINKYLAVAWAGVKLAASIIIEQMQKAFSKEKPPSKKELEEFFNNIDPWCKDKINIVGVAYDGIDMFSFGYDCLGFTSKKFGEVRVAGSGSNDLKGLMELLEKSSMGITESTKFNPLEIAVSNALSISSYFTGLEITSGANLTSYYGGGYEILSLVKGAFTKIQDVTYLVWVCEIHDDGALSLDIPKLLIKHSYIDEFLLIRRILIEQSESNKEKLSVSDDTCYIVEPLTKSLRGSGINQIELPTIHSDFTCNYILVSDGQNNKDLLNVVSFTPSGKYPIKLVKKNGREAVAINEDFVKTIASEVQEKYKKL